MGELGIVSILGKSSFLMSDSKLLTQDVGGSSYSQASVQIAADTAKTSAVLLVLFRPWCPYKHRFWICSLSGT